MHYLRTSYLVLFFLFSLTIYYIPLPDLLQEDRIPDCSQSVPTFLKELDCQDDETDGTRQNSLMSDLQKDGGYLSARYPALDTPLPDFLQEDQILDWQDFSQSVPTFLKELDCQDDETDGTRQNSLICDLQNDALDIPVPDLLQEDRIPGWQKFSLSVPTSLKELDCQDDETDGTRQNSLMCDLDTVQNNPTQDNLTKALVEDFGLEDKRKCLICEDSGGACGHNLLSGVFICYCIDEQTHVLSLHNRTCGSNFLHVRNKGLSTGQKQSLGIGAASAVGVVILVLAVGLIYQRKKPNYLRQQNLKALIPLKHYSYAQVKRITKSFAEEVGKGGFATVYRGTLADGRSVAVKILKDSNGNGEDFINEVASMSKTSHVNIVDLLGFCSEGSKRAILYEFMENGSLDRFISRNTSMKLDWAKLYTIALGIARGLEYLHHGCKSKIVHFDIKPQNVLLDDNLCPKVSDFGLAKLCEKKESTLSLLNTRGTIGYIAPEVISRMYGRVSHKSDVYSYGMLVLEMIGARNKERAQQNSASNPSSMYFPEWIYKDLEKGDTGRLIENGISSEDEEVAKKMTLVGLWCIQSYPSDRPAMNRVVEMMEGNLDALEVPPRPVLQVPQEPLQESSTLSEDISDYTEV